MLVALSPADKGNAFVSTAQHHHEPGLPLYSDALKTKSFGHLCDCLLKIYVDGTPESLVPDGPPVIVPLTCIDVPDTWYGRIVAHPDGGFILLEDVGSS